MPLRTCLRMATRDGFLLLVLSRTAQFVVHVFRCIQMYSDDVFRCIRYLNSNLRIRFVALGSWKRQEVRVVDAATVVALLRSKAWCNLARNGQAGVQPPNLLGDSHQHQR